MVLILYRIMANIPVILMGETGCGKTGLIRKLYQLKNIGENMAPKNNTVNLNSTIDIENLIKKIDEIYKLAKAKVKKDKENKEFLVFFNEINTCNSLGLIN